MLSTWLAVLGLVLSAATLLSGCSESSASPVHTATATQPASTATVAPATTPPTSPSATPADMSSRGRWSANAVWPDAGLPASGTAWAVHCGAPSPSSFDRSNGVACVSDVMRAAGAHPEAIEFFEEYGYFLAVFEELGTVDFGQGQAPWVSMGRPNQPLLLNGTPANLDLSDGIIRAYEKISSRTDPVAQSYATIMEESDLAFPQPDRSLLVGSESKPDGSQTITLSVTIQSCRACSVLAYMVVELDLSADGTLVGTTLLPLRVP